MAAGMFAWFVTSALYLQHVLHYDPLEVGLAFLPADLIIAIFSAGLSAPMVTRFGTRKPLAIGLLLSAAGLVLLARAPIEGTFITDVLPAMVLLGLAAVLSACGGLLAALVQRPRTVPAAASSTPAPG